jgi:hypothetical protein
MKSVTLQFDATEVTDGEDRDANPTHIVRLYSIIE